jgi:glycerophosphoryl diester phosphodiesterase
MVALPRVIGHRGAAGLAPENTLAGFRAARAAGVRWVEFDVRLTADRVPVVIHDPTLDRVAGLAAPVARLTAARLAAVDAGARFAPRFAGERVPTLAEALAECRALGLGANVELKWCGVRSLALARRAAEFLRAASDVPLLVSSFRPALLGAVRRAAPDVPRGLLLERLRPGWRAAARRFGCATVNLDVREADDRAIDAVRAAGYGMVVYTVNEPAQAARLLAAGVDAVITDRPDLIADALS